MSDDPSGSDADFVPKGALLFFGALVAFYGLVWLALYRLMVGRS